ncbi:hypothetical protein [Candidatus Rariloculus sp.]|uniref:hypothetical protein n=1 Tax=Candidatus Rariloculus sp. TaxID=3101265 RepID=UPI003D0F6E21
MKIFNGCCIALASLFALPVLACENPPLAVVPDGENATMEELQAAQEDVRIYMEAMNEYIACVDEELDSAGDDAPELFQSLMVSRHNIGVEEMELVAESFNEQVRAWREANPAPEEEE